ncbi:hypothetical protein CZ794_06320 [Psychrobacter sp. JB385]|nr:hypothetical protein CZ794_06320 [Psychrobacter sp. JB385]
MKNKNEGIFVLSDLSKTNQDTDRRLIEQSIKEHKADCIHWGLTIAFQAMRSDLYHNLLK